MGAFVVGAFAILAGFVIFTGGMSALREQNERFVLVFHENIYGLNEGGKVTLNGVRIGRVERFFLGDAAQDAPVPVLIEINQKLVHRHMAEQNNELFDNDGKFRTDVLSHMEGQLVQESFVTGIIYVNLEHDPLLPDSNITKLYGYREIPSRKSTLEELSASLDPERLGKQLNKLLGSANQRLEELDVISIKESFRAASQDFRIFIEKFSETFGPLGPKFGVASDEAAQTLLEMRKLSASLNRMVEPSSDFRFGFDETLREISQAMKALKTLAELLERNPQAVLRGKGEEQE